jgi:intracellular proteinase inhibitor BsuPI
MRLARYRSCIAATIGFGAVVASGCSESESEPCAPFTSALAIKDKFDQVADVFTVGELIRFDLQITNWNRDSATLGGPDGCSLVLFSVSDRVGETVWTSNDGIYCFAVPIAVTFAPGETKNFGLEWPQRVREGSQASEGPYTVHASGRQGSCLFGSAGFTIQ